MISASDLVDKFRYALEHDWGYIWGKSGQLWTQQDQNNSSREMTVRYGQKWVGHYVADCSGLFRWAFKQLGSDIHHGSNLIFDCDCTTSGKLKGGKRTDGQELKPGTAIFTGSDGDHGHIGLYVGNGRIIEAKGTQYGVVDSPITEARWTWWGELKNTAYDAEPTPAPEPKPGEKPTLRKGDRGEYVTLAQTELIQHGYNCGDTGADGVFGTQTEKAVKRFQQDNVGEDGQALTVDGVIGKNTWWALDQTSLPLYTVTIPHLAKFHADALVANYSGAYMTEERG